MHEEHRHSNKPRLESYVTGFALAILFTLASFGAAYLHLNSDHHLFSHEIILPFVIILAVVQIFAQAIFFLHLTHRTEGRLNLVAFVFTIYTVAFIVLGSLWIMQNLDANMSPQQLDAYLQKEN